MGSHQPASDTFGTKEVKMEMGRANSEENRLGKKKTALQVNPKRKGR